MAFTIVGLTENKIVLKRENVHTDPNGLNTIIMNFAVRTQDIGAVQPNVGYSHAEFCNRHGISKSIFYSTMKVVSVNTEEQDGGLSEMIVTFEGLMYTGTMPLPIVRYIPTEGQGIYGPPIVIQAEYVTLQSDSQFLALFDPQNNLAQPVLWFAQRKKMPRYINGYEMPKDPKEAFFATPGTGGGIIQEYLGYCYLSVACERRGGALLVTSSFGEVQNIAQVIGCWVAREVYGESNPDWLLFRGWLMNLAPKWFFNGYIKYGERIARLIRNKKSIKWLIKLWMDSKIKKIRI